MGISLKQAKALYGERVYEQIKQKMACGQKKGGRLTAVEAALKKGNPFEERLEAILKQAFEPDFTVLSQVSGLVPGRRFVVDFFIPELSTVCEADGWQFHGKYLEDFQRDREREQLLVVEGYTILRFSTHQVMSEEAAKEAVALLERFKARRIKNHVNLG
jgi:very-short-patch-repair endonuclease